MTLISIARSSLLGLMTLALNACAAPREHYYLLEPSAPQNMVVLAKSATVLIGPVVIPAEVDRPQIVVRKGPHEVVFNEQERWAVPLKEALPRFLAGELSRKAKNTRFVSNVSGVTSTAKAQLAIDVIRFEVSSDAGATVALHWVYRSTTTNLPTLEGDAVAHSPVENREVESLLEGLRRATTEAADTIAGQVLDDS